jgi:ATP-dependent exoDNAse (exonuclease V) beta subunit
VGDQNQSIYRFRGSTNNAFDELRKVLNKPITTTLNINYRCAPTIIGYVSNTTENFMYAGVK